MLESKGCRIRTSCEVHKVSTNDEGECLKLSDQTSFSFLLVLNEHALSNLLMTHSYNLIVLIFYMNYTRFHSSLWRWVWGNIQWMHNGCPRPRRRENIRKPGNIRWTESTWCLPICLQVNFSYLIWGKWSSYCSFSQSRIICSTLCWQWYFPPSWQRFNAPKPGSMECMEFSW